jgi:dolichol-phosphate mannosyltransferase
LNAERSAAQRILIAVATYNEIENLPRLVDGLREYAPGADILVVDDHSPDGTGKWCDVQAAVDSRFQVIHRPTKSGLGSATIAGLQFAIANGYQLVVTMDADCSHDPKYLPGMLAAIQNPDEPVDVVVGSRYAAGGGIEGWPVSRRIMSRCINWYARWLLRLQPQDCSGAYRCFRVDMLRSLDFSTVRSQGYSLLEELLWMIQRQGGRIKEVPITFVDRTHGQSKISYREAWLALWIIFRLALRRR